MQLGGHQSTKFIKGVKLLQFLNIFIYLISGLHLFFADN